AHQAVPVQGLRGVQYPPREPSLSRPPPSGFREALAMPSRGRSSRRTRAPDRRHQAPGQVSPYGSPSWPPVEIGPRHRPTRESPSRSSPSTERAVRLLRGATRFSVSRRAVPGYDQVLSSLLG